MLDLVYKTTSRRWRHDLFDEENENLFEEVEQMSREIEQSARVFAFQNLTGNPLRLNSSHREGKCSCYQKTY